jgi:hypothetical protein
VPAVIPIVVAEELDVVVDSAQAAVVLPQVSTFASKGLFERMD